MVNGRELLARASVQMLTKTTSDELVPACEILLFYLFTNNLYVPTEIRILKRAWGILYLLRIALR